MYTEMAMQLPGYKCELRDVICEFGMGEGQESEMFTKKYIKIFTFIFFHSHWLYD